MPNAKSSWARIRQWPQAAIRIRVTPLGFARRSARMLAVATAMLLTGLAVYGASLDNDFVMDDEEQIINNRFVHSLDNIPKMFTGSTMNAGGTGELSGMYYKPLMTVSYALLWAAGDGKPWPFHLFQLFVHVANALLLYFVFRHFFSGLASFALGMIYLVHPVNTEAVVYIADLQDVLYTFFGLGAVLLCIGGQNTWWRMPAVGALLFLSLLSKESGILAVVACLSYAALFHRRRLWPVLAWATAAGSVYLWLRIGVADLHRVNHNIVDISRVSLGVRLMTLPKILVHYLSVFFYPAVLTVTQNWVVKNATFQAFWGPLAVCGGVLAGLSLALWKTAEKRAFFFFLLWLAAGLGLHSQIVPLDGTVANRWLYFAVGGALGLAGIILRDLTQWAKSQGLSERGLTEPQLQQIAAGLIGAVIACLGARAFERTFNWKNGLTLYRHDVQHLPGSYDLQNNVGVELFRRDRVKEALPYFQKSVELAPHWDTNWNNLGAAHEALGNLEKAEKYYLKSIKNGTYYRAYENYAKILYKKKDFGGLERFLEGRALRIFPENKLFHKLAAFLERRVRQSFGP